MKLLIVAVLLTVAPSVIAAAHPFRGDGLVMMDRLGESVLSPDGRSIALHLREKPTTRQQAKHSIWIVPTAGASRPA